MTRRWLVSGGSLMICTTLAAMAAAQGQSSPTFSERFQQLRSGWGGESAEATDESATEAEAQPQAPTAERRSMLPKVDPRSLMPNNFFSRSTAKPTSQPTQPTPATSPQRTAAERSGLKPGAAASARAATQRAGSAQAARSAANSAMLPGVGSSTTASANATASEPTPAPNGRKLSPITPVMADSRPSPATAAPAARRSPEHRTPPNFDSEALRSELSSSFGPPPALATEATPEAATASNEPTPNEPTPADEFAAGLEKEAATLGRMTTVKSKPTTVSAPADAITPIPAGPITLQPSKRSTKPASRPQTGTQPAEDRYAQPTFPSVGGLIGRKTEFAPPAETATATAAPAADAPVIVSDNAAVKAFRYGAPSTPTTGSRTVQASPYTSREATPAPSKIDRSESFAEPTLAGPTDSALLVSNQAPAISSDIRGPQQITIGREATYELRLKNTGASAAEELVATVRIPSWADVVTTTATHGIIRQGEGSEPSSALQWHIAKLEANAEETITLKLIPRASRPLELGVTWTHAPVDSRTIVEVQEPKLRMLVSGPDEVLYGKPHVYRLTLTNPGTGLAENVRIDLLPPGGGRESVSTHSLGNLPPGESKSVEVELTAREAGKLNVQAIASADGGLTSEANKELFCRKPELQVDWRGPETQYAGTPATYFFRVRNPGTAAADDVNVRVALPSGAEFVSASEGYRHDADAGEIMWRVGSLGPGDDCYMELRCIVHTPGENQLRVAAATSAGDLADNKLAATKVVALADLKLDVGDPAGPVLVGDEAIYEICVTNRGASAAEDVNVIGLFSAGLEPETVDGTAYTATDGRVSFRTIRKLPAGQNVVLQIRARATQQGTHVFRAEVLCRDLEIKLAAEETTRFYENAVMHDPMGPTPTVIGSKEANVVR